MGSTFFSSIVPTTLFNKEIDKLKRSNVGGNCPTFPITFPAKESDFVLAGSRFVPIAINPPGEACLTNLPPVINDSIVVVIASVVFLPSISIFLPGQISIRYDQTNS